MAEQPSCCPNGAAPPTPRTQPRAPSPQPVTRTRHRRLRPNAAATASAEHALDGRQPPLPAHTSSPLAATGTLERLIGRRGARANRLPPPPPCPAPPHGHHRRPCLLSGGAGGGALRLRIPYGGAAFSQRFAQKALTAACGGTAACLLVPLLKPVSSWKAFGLKEHITGTGNKGSELGSVTP